MQRSPDPAFRQIALDSLPQAEPSGNTDADILLLIFMDDQHNKRVSKRLSQPPHPLEIG
jgi:hypothetical protein